MIFHTESFMNIKKTSLLILFMHFILVNAQKPVPESPQLIEVAQFGKYQPIGVTVT